MLVITSPIMLITGIAIKLYDGGPCLFQAEKMYDRGKSI
ncbi:hypothetical protein M5E84_02565 [[Ruminococcus] torques]|nr:hypothetical protein M5E84_02565 [[Ruminococcus] torques]